MPGSGEEAASEPLFFASARGWETWLRRNHDRTPDGVWLRFYKKAAGRKSLTYAEAVEIALCYGWIDGQGRSEGETSMLQRYTPRRKRSVWSKRNTEHAERLVAEGRMQPAGLREIERAKGDGRWDRAYEPPSTARPPEDFLAALRKNRKAAAFFETLTKSNTYAIYYRVQSARRPDTRARRIAALVKGLAEGKKP